MAIRDHVSSMAHGFHLGAYQLLVRLTTIVLLFVEVSSFYSNQRVMMVVREKAGFLAQRR